MKIQIFTPTEFYGVVMDTATKHRGIFIDQEYPAPNRVLLQYRNPALRGNRRLLRPA